MGRGMHDGTKEIIAAARDILEAIQPASVRAVCYKLFVAGLIPDMSKNSTGKVSKALVAAREKGMIPWEWIVDGSREVRRLSTWDTPRQKMEVAMEYYRYDYWNDQPYRVHLIVEKETVASTLQPVLDEFAVPVSFMKGFSSATAANDLAAIVDRSDKPVRFFYCGDWDPSGMYMSEEDLPGRIAKYGGEAAADAWFERIAISKEDTEMDLPSFAASDKSNDSRYKWFTSKFGDRCWELDAMDPNDLRARVRKHIEIWLDHYAWDHSRQIEDAQRGSIEAFMSGLPRGLG